MKKISVRQVAGPTVLVSLLLFAACSFAAVVLYRWHARTAEHLTEDIESRKLSAEIDNNLRTLVKYVEAGSNEDLSSLHKLIAQRLEETREFLNSEEEETLQTQLEESFDSYQHLWLLHGSGRKGNPALDHLRKETLPLSGRIRAYHAQQIDASEAALRRTVKGIAWTLAGVGVIGSLAGLILGFGVARGLRQSFYQLSVSLANATDKLRHELPTVTIRTGEGMDHLHDQMGQLTREVEQTVQRLQQREREVLRAEQMAAVGQLAAGVAHELRNPLTAVKMLVQTSREDMESRGLPAEDLQVIENEIRRLEGSLQRFLDFARPPRMERRPIKLDEVIEEALALTAGRARLQKVHVDFRRPERSIVLHADAGQLRQLLVNLILNAFDVMPRGGQLLVSAGQDASGQVELQVRDTGPGIDAGVFPRLFEPFVSGKETGLGLGLVVSRRIAEGHGGTLTGVNLPGGGACFMLRLPAGELETLLATVP